MESPVSAWEDPQCPFRVEWAPEKLNKVRIAVVDAFYSMPRGGIEVGGLLLGRVSGRTLFIDDFAPIECEHLTGPSFALSEKDEAALAAQVAALSNPPIGWYHSHTRSDLDFSENDAEIHNRFFSQSFQLAMILRPSTSQPTRANYFFRSRGGVMRGGQQAFVVPAVKTKPNAPVEAAVTRPQVSPPSRPPLLPDLPASRPALPPNPVPSRTALPPTPVPSRPPLPPDSIPEPAFSNRVHPVPKSRGQLWMALSLLLLAGLGAGAFATKDLWLTKEQEPLKLRASDVDGKLIIRWIPVHNLTSGDLRIDDGGKSTDIKLDAAQIRDGIYAYTRQSPSETVRLKVGSREETTVYAGPLTAPRPKNQ